MGGGEVLKRGWLIKSPPLEGGGIKVPISPLYLAMTLAEP